MIMNNGQRKALSPTVSQTFSDSARGQATFSGTPTIHYASTGTCGQSIAAQSAYALEIASIYIAVGNFYRISPSRSYFPIGKNGNGLAYSRRTHSKTGPHAPAWCPRANSGEKCVQILI